MLTDTLLPAILGKGILGIKVAPVTIAADQARGGMAVRRDIQPDPGIGEVGIAGLVIEPGDARSVQMLDLLALHHPVFHLRLHAGVLGRFQDAVGIIGGDAAPRILDDRVGRIADLDRGVAVVPGVLVAGDPDHHREQTLLHLVVGAHVQGGIAAAAPGRIAAPGAIEIVVDPFLAVGADKVAGLDFAVQVEAIADAAGDFRLARIVGRPGVHIRPRCRACSRDRTWLAPRYGDG